MITLKKPQCNTARRFLSTACLFDCFDDDSLCVFAGEICDSQVRDGLSATGLFFRIDGNLGNLYCYSWRVAIDNYNASFLFLGHGVTPKNICHVYVILIKTSTRGVWFSGSFYFGNTMVLSWQCRGLYDDDIEF
jgi:hypothetical protein